MKPISIKPFVLPRPIENAILLLVQNGFTSYLVGGCVRDHLLGRTPKDYDIATSGRVEQVLKIFPQAITVGKRFGVLKIFDEIWFEVATFRKEGHYKDFRHPEWVEFASAQEDAKRRDFTVNALFYDSLHHFILDYVGGIDDLKHQRLRTVGDPSQRFEEDPLRLLRGIRFAAYLNFTIDINTYSILKKKIELIRKISIERIRQEFLGLLEPALVKNGLHWLEKSGLAYVLFPYWDFTGLSRVFVEKEHLFYAVFRKHAHQASDDLKMPSHFQRCMKFFIQHINKLSDSFDRDFEYVNILEHPDFFCLYRFCIEDGCHVSWQHAVERLKNFVPWMCGVDLLRLNIKPGPIYRIILAQLKHATLLGRIQNYQQALKFTQERYSDLHKQ